MNRLSFRRVLLTACLVLAPLATTRAQQAYQSPSADLVKILEAPANPITSISPNRQWVLVTVSDPRTITISDMADSAYYLAGSKIRANPDYRIENIGIRSGTVSSIDGKVERQLQVPAGGRLGSTAWSVSGNELAYTTISNGDMSLEILDLATGRTRHVTASGLSGKIRDLDWSRDGKHLAFTVTRPSGTAVMVADVATASARRVTAQSLNFTTARGNIVDDPGCNWLNGKAPLVCRLWPANRKAAPVTSEIPTGVIVQESYGRSAPARTYEYLLQGPGDEALFDYYFTDQLSLIGVDGKITPIGPAGIHTRATPSPDGKYLLVETVQRPYSYQVPMDVFPSRTEVWDLNGKVLREIRNSHVAEEAPSARDAVVPGIRNVNWHPDAPATLVMVEALDKGNPRNTVPKRDQVSLLSAPFAGAATPFIQTEYRYGVITWIDPKTAFLVDRLSRGARQRLWMIDPSAPNGGTPKLVWDRSAEDRYSNPGALVTVLDPATERFVPLRSSDGKSLYLRGDGASSEGDRPFIDRFDIATGKTERLWQSSAPNYEQVLQVVDPDATRIITQRESPTDPPNIFVRDLRNKSVTQVTKVGDPAPYFANVKSELITYTRPDGVKLSATLYLPPGYDKSKGRLPFFFWAYPREFQSADAASQLAGSPYQFKRPGRQNYLMLLMHGYGVLDGPTMPIVGVSGKEPNDSYIEQLVASAQAAVDKIVDMGIADRDRVAIGGHSYGAFMTVNLLAHSDIFRTGIAESGAYNRTLTPFGFQAEPRTYWEAPEVYNAMSPFNYANKIKAPVLLIHGQRDDNSGTFPIQSERLFAAIKGNGGNVRYVQLPLEPHGYTSVETQRHLLWEYINWLDKYVKNAPPRAATSATAGSQAPK
ncbi:MAG TPA: prolyl oligopeptidase family serine peptidase [Gemmatimonadaceae bacterium]|jgi:dipeptidyl aminopeptidase/acylaminoacyl peptidase|nr:prolyl oligopeptidase family serine peptidase [Gemmatimonadaceae bacterium]